MSVFQKSTQVCNSLLLYPKAFLHVFPHWNTKIPLWSTIILHKEAGDSLALKSSPLIARNAWRHVHYLSLELYNPKL